MFIEALFTIAERWNQFRCPSTEERINNMWYVHTMKYTALKRNEILIHTIRQVNFENIISEISQT